MDRPSPAAWPSPLRGRLNSFENAYVVVARMRRIARHPLFIVRTTEPSQPILVTPAPCETDDIITVLI